MSTARTDVLALRLRKARDRLASGQPLDLAMDALTLEVAGDLAKAEPGFLAGHFADLAGVTSRTAQTLAHVGDAP